MSYIKDFLHYTSGNECPEPYRLWSGLSLLASVLGRKVWTFHGRFQIFPSLYVVLVGDAGSGKSTAKNYAKKLFTSNFTEYLASASFHFLRMCSVETSRLYTQASVDQTLQRIYSPW